MGSLFSSSSDEDDSVARRQQLRQQQRCEQQQRWEQIQQQQEERQFRQNQQYWHQWYAQQHEERRYEQALHRASSSSSHTGSTTRPSPPNSSSTITSTTTRYCMICHIDITVSSQEHLNSGLHQVNVGIQEELGNPSIYGNIIVNRVTNTPSNRLTTATPGGPGGPGTLNASNRSPVATARSSKITSTSLSLSSFHRSLRAGDECDIRDTSLCWLLCYIISSNEQYIHIHYIGRDKKWNETISRGSERIAKPLEHSGKKQTTQRPCPLAFKVPKHDVQHTPICAYRDCRKHGRYRCARCLSSYYCNKQHQQQHWFSQHHRTCPNEIRRIARDDVGFGVDTMHVQLRPSRGMTLQQKYTAFSRSEPARFNCTSRHSWPSGKACFDTNLHSHEIVKIYTQECKRCEEKCEPEFEHVVEMITNLFIWLRDLRDKEDDRDHRNRPITKPHLHELCEKCEFGRNPHDH